MGTDIAHRYTCIKTFAHVVRLHAALRLLCSQFYVTVATRVVWAPASGHRGMSHSGTWCAMPGQKTHCGVMSGFRRCSRKIPYALAMVFVMLPRSRARRVGVKIRKLISGAASYPEVRSAICLRLERWLSCSDVFLVCHVPHEVRYVSLMSF